MDSKRYDFFTKMNNEKNRNEKHKYFDVNEENFLFFLSKMKEILPLEKLLKQYDKDLINLFCRRFKMYGKEINFSKEEVFKFNNILKNLYLTNDRFLEIIKNEE